MNWKRSVYAVLAIVPVVLLLAFGLTRDPSGSRMGRRFAFPTCVGTWSC